MKKLMIKYFEELLSDDISVKDIQKIIYIEVLIFIFGGVLWNADLWFTLIITGENTTLGLILLNIMLFILWRFIELQYYSLQHIIRKGRKE